MVNLPDNVTIEDLRNLFGLFGVVHKIRIGNVRVTHGEAFIYYRTIFDAKNALEYLSGRIVWNRRLSVMYYYGNDAFKDRDI